MGDRGFHLQVISYENLAQVGNVQKLLSSPGSFEDAVKVFFLKE